MFMPFFGLLINLLMATKAHQVAKLPPQERVLSEHVISMGNRYPDKYVNDIFKYNILLNLDYLGGRVRRGDQIQSVNIDKSLSFEINLKPGEVFTFHDDILDEYKKKTIITSNTHFNYQDGFKSDGYLTGDGVCHLASIIYWAASDAHLQVLAPTNHNFYPIPEVPKEYGVAIYYMPGDHFTNSKQNLYITNNLNKDISFKFDYDGSDLKVSVAERSLST